MAQPQQVQEPQDERTLTERELEVLRSLTTEWVRPMDIGGRDGSDHSRVLASLARKGFVERRRRDSLMNALGSSRGSYVYRNPRYVKPKRRLTNFDHCYRFTRILAGYDCAGIDQEPDATTRCGKCGPCEAYQFVQSRPGLALSMLEDE